MDRDHFVIAGGQRCGTTYLYGLLDEHPEIEMARPLRPEPKFFLDAARCAEGYDAYRRYFSDEPLRVLGEKSTSYMELEVAAQRIAALLPKALVVVILRDPVERAISHFRFSVQNGVEDLAIDDVLRDPSLEARPYDAARISVSPYAYLRRGHYADYLRQMTRHIDRERLVTIVFEELLQDPGVLTGLFDRLGVDRHFVPASVGAPANRGEGVRASEETVAWLRDYYIEPVREVEKLLGRSLPWGRDRS